jgi:hypothetical protein
MASSNHRSLVSRATEGTEAPTPGYLYVDLCKAATGNPTAAQDMVVLLTRRLASKQNPTIKYKCLKVLTKLCEGVPRNAFRRFLAQDHEGITAIKESMTFRGAPDPVRGDTNNEKVRVAAKECLDAVYREAPTSETSMPSSSANAHAGGGMNGGGGYGGGGGGGYGGVSSSYGAPPHQAGGAYNGMPSRMQGIGNPMFKDPRLEPEVTPTQAFQNVVKEASEVIVGMIKDPLARSVPMPEPPRHSTGSYGGPTVRVECFIIAMVIVWSFVVIIVWSIVSCCFFLHVHRHLFSPFSNPNTVRSTPTGRGRFGPSNGRRMDDGVQSWTGRRRLSTTGPTTGRGGAATPTRVRYVVVRPRHGGWIVGPSEWWSFPAQYHRESSSATTTTCECGRFGRHVRKITCTRTLSPRWGQAGPAPRQTRELCPVDSQLIPRFDLSDLT